MNASEVKPGKWLWDEDYEPVVLYDDGAYSAIWGKYENRKCLGVRYNGTDGEDVGYPNQGGHPTWYVEPMFLTLPLLTELLLLSIKANNTLYQDRVKYAIQEFTDQQSSSNV